MKRAPKNPIRQAIILLLPTVSPRTIPPNIVTINGSTKNIAMASANGIYFIAETNEPVPIKIKIARKKCNLISERFGLCAQVINKAIGNNINACIRNLDKIIWPIGTSSAANLANKSINGPTIAKASINNIPSDIDLF